MNIINKLLLRFVLLPSSLYRKMGVETRHLKIILTTKLTMDDRRPNTFHQTSQRKSTKAISGATTGTMIFSTILGALFIFTFRISEVPVTQFTLYFSIYIFMLANTLVSDFTSVLIDVRDNFIILPKPVSDKTFVLSRLLHILIHITKIILPMASPAMVYVAVVYGGWAAVVFFLAIISATIFTVFLINIIYLIILKFTSPKKFQNVISFVQIFMTIVLFAGYQLMPTLMQKIKLEHFDISTKPWIWVLPSYWLALGWEFFTSFSFKPELITGALLLLSLPVISLWSVIKFFAPSFNQKLSLISGNSEESGSMKVADAKNQHLKVSFSEGVASMLFLKKVERMGFLITWKLTGRLKDFKLKVYPSIGYLFVFVILIFIRNNGISPDKLRAGLGGDKSIVMTVFYSCSFLLILAIGELQYSEKFKAAWFYFTAPIKQPGLIFSGAVKAVIIKFYLPVATILSVIALSFIGIKVLPNIILGLSNVLLGCVILSLITLRNFPFSAAQQTSQKAGSFLRGLISFSVIVIFGFAHYLVYNIRFVVIISIFLSLLANWLLFDYMKNKTWSKIIHSYRILS